MEKIYMDEYNDDPKRPRKSKMFRFSIVLSFVVAIFSVVSLVVIGFGNLSMAAPTPHNPDDDFTFFFGMNGSDAVAIVAKSASSTFYVPVYLATANNISSGVPLFCLEHNTDVDDDSGSGMEYENGGVLDDHGLTYIFNKSGVLGGEGILKSNSEIEADPAAPRNKLIEIYATQIAIWLYLTEKHPTETRYSLQDYTGTNDAAHNLETIREANQLTFNGYPTLSSASFGDGELYDTIHGVVSTALGITSDPVNLVINGSTNISKVDDNTFQTSELSVSAGTNTVTSFTVSTSGITGAKVVDSAGVEKTTFNTSDKFYVRIPMSSVPANGTASLNVHVEAKIDNYIQGSYYVSKTNGDLQKLAIVTGNQRDVPADKVFDVARVPDTKLNRAQTIYFIGLIVLLCGVGIIYANTKQDEEAEN